MKTILYRPPADRPDVLADSVGGGKVPVWFRGLKWQSDGTLSANVWQRAGLSMPNGAPRALLLSLAGTPDAIGMGRAAAIVAGSDMAIFLPHPLYSHGWRVVSEADSVAGTIAAAVTFFAPVTSSDHAFSSRNLPEYVGMGVLANPPPGVTGGALKAWALATILAARIGGSVEVVDVG